MTNTQHRIERLKQVYFHNCREPFYTRDCEYINTIDFDNNTVYYVQYVQENVALSWKIGGVFSAKYSDFDFE